MRRLAAVVAIAALALTLVGCGTVRSTVDTYRALDNAGYTNISVNYDNSNGFESVVVRTAGGPSEDAQAKAAQIVWTTFKFKFDQVDVAVAGKRQVFTRSDLLEQFGPRPPGSDKDLGKDVLRTIGVVGAIFMLFLGLVVLIIVLVVRNSRRKHPPPPVWYGGPPPPPPPGSHWGTPPPPG